MTSLASLLPHLGQDMPWLPPGISAAQQAEELQAAVQAAQAEAEVRHAGALALLEAEHARQLADARRSWTEEEGMRLTRHLVDLVGVAETRIAEAAARCLAPFMVTLARQAAAADLVSKLKAEAAGELRRHISLTGPEDLVTAVSKELQKAGFGDVSVAHASQDLQAVIGDSRIASHLHDWLSALGSAVDG